MKFVTFFQGSRTFPGVVKEGRIIKLESFRPFRERGLSGSKDLLPLIEVEGNGGGVVSVLKEEIDSIRPSPAEAPRLEDVRLMPPILRPPAIFCLGFNFRSHAPELKRPIPEVPIVFMKPSGAVVGPEDEVILPKAASRVDYEVEMTVVIGKKGRYIPAAGAYGHVFGYTILNDITARDIQQRDFSLSRPWLRSKGFDTFAPTGPFIVTADEIDPMNTGLRLRVNGELRQESSTREMIFDVPKVVEYISSFTTLEPGAIIAMGTPEKIGQLNDGDVVEAEIDGIGVLRNRAVLER